jgi:hypothetical protein
LKRPKRQGLLQDDAIHDHEQKYQDKNNLCFTSYPPISPAASLEKLSICVPERPLDPRKEQEGAGGGEAPAISKNPSWPSCSSHLPCFCGELGWPPLPKELSIAVACVEYVGQTVRKDRWEQWLLGPLWRGEEKEVMAVGVWGTRLALLLWGRGAEEEEEASN